MGIRSAISPRSIAIAIAVLGSIIFASRAGAVVTGDPIPDPLNGWVGYFRGSSCVAVGNFWCITAKHVGDGTGYAVYMRGQVYPVLETIPHPTYDVQLLRVGEALPGYHPLASHAGLGDPCVLGGFGATAGASLPNHTGYDWSGPHVETWGENTIEGEGGLLSVRFDAPNSNWAVPHEAIFAVNDSGAGLFIPGPGGTLNLAGIAVSVTSFGSSPYSSAAFCLNVDLFRNWMMPIVDPSHPLSSAVEAPRAALTVPDMPGWMGGAIVALAFRNVRRRR